MDVKIKETDDDEGDDDDDDEHQDTGADDDLKRIQMERQDNRNVSDFDSIVLSGSTNEPIDKEYCAKKLRILRHKIALLSQELLEIKFGNTTQKSRKPVCTRYKNEGRITARHNITNIWSNENIINRDEISFVTQLTLKRMPALALVAEHWSGPIDVALYVKQEELPLVHAKVRNYTSLLNRKDIQLHIVIAEGVSFILSQYCVWCIKNLHGKKIFLEEVKSYKQKIPLLTLPSHLFSKTAIFAINFSKPL